MPTLIPFLTQTEDPTMVLSNQSSSQITSVTPSKPKAVSPVFMSGEPSPVVTKSVMVPSFRKKNGSLVAPHTRIVAVNKPTYAKKVTANQKKKRVPKITPVLKFRPGERDPSVTLAKSLYITELQNSMRPKSKDTV
jgi:hypothetical protein